MRYTDIDYEMPPKKQLPEAEIATLVEWVQRGAPAARTANVVCHHDKEPRSGARVSSAYL